MFFWIPVSASQLCLIPDFPGPGFASILSMCQNWSPNIQLRHQDYCSPKGLIQLENPFTAHHGPQGVQMTQQLSGKSLPHTQELGGSEEISSLSLAAASSSEMESLWQAGEAPFL